MPGVPCIKFNDGYEYPIIGLGTWQSQPGEVYEAVKAAIDIGYRHLDCALVYGNETQIGQAIEEKIKEGVLRREDLFVTSKLWCNSHKKGSVIPALKKTLENLRLAYLDLYLMHWPMGFKEGEELFPKDSKGKIIPGESPFTEAWKGLEECVKLGLARSIGVSNFNHKQIDELLKVATITPVNNQIECHPYLNQQRLIDYCRERDISVTAYSPLGSPGRAEAKPDDPSLLDDPVVQSLSKKYKKTAAQILIRYQIERGIPVIPKSVTKSRIESNFQVFDFELSKEELDSLNKLNRNARFVLFDMSDNLKDYPFHEDF